jgi:transcriptional regulator with GAF, ATPase, and Fis domain
MDDFFLLVWREAARRIEIEGSIDRIAQLIAPRLPADTLILRRVDVSHARLEAVTAASCVGGAVPALGRTQCSADEFNELLVWCRGARTLHARRAQGALARILQPQDVSAEWIAGPLARDGEPVGVLLIVAQPGRAFTSHDEALVSGLLEPLAMALANSEHFHNLARAQEAMEADNRALLSRLDRDTVSGELVGADAGLRAVLERANLVAPTDAPVLILGETGTGKEVLARAIHARSQRSAGPVVRVNCGALPPGLIDSELFGHERGSFTGATNVRRGWFERADGGTLFLDEIGELPLDAQVRLLRILQDGTFERVGGHKSLRVDVRIVAATHRDLHEMVSAGTFREDLWYRISVFPISLPPLRDRVEDIPALASHFAWRAGKRLGGTPLSPTPADFALLASYPWPGNVRELASVIERAAILGDGHELKIAAALGGDTARPPLGRGITVRGVPLQRVTTLDDVVARHIEMALAATNGRIEGPYGAALQLGINPHTLRAKMRKLGIEWKRFREKRAAVP